MTDIFSVPPLPWAYDALAGRGMSEQQIKYHKDVHHQSYATKLNAAAKTNEAIGKKTIEELILTEKGPIFNLAAQIWNHTFFWSSLAPNGGGAPPAGSRINDEINASFGSYEKFRAEFSAAAVGHFGSGWVWLVKDPKDSKTKVVQTHDAGCPLTDGLKPLLTIDCWEHAWYADFGPKKQAYVDNVLDKLINWSFAEQNLLSASKQ
jgi:Fe-Mn family superoxide dismutase